MTTFTETPPEQSKYHGRRKKAMAGTGPGKMDPAFKSDKGKKGYPKPPVKK